MSILIPRMAMPKSCKVCPLKGIFTCQCKADEGIVDVSSYVDSRHPDCNLTFVEDPKLEKGGD